MNNLTKALIELINENPDLPVITMVDSEVVSDDSYGRWYSSIGSSHVDEYVVYEKLHSDKSNIIYKDDIDEIVEDLMERNEALTDEQAEKMAQDHNWKKAIFLNIELPDFD